MNEHNRVFFLLLLRVLQLVQETETTKKEGGRLWKAYYSEKSASVLSIILIGLFILTHTNNTTTTFSIKQGLQQLEIQLRIVLLQLDLNLLPRGMHFNQLDVF